MTSLKRWVSVSLLFVGCGQDVHVGTLDAGPPCMPSSASEVSCSDSVDDDCDGYRDCLDTDCEAQTCGSGGGLTCTAGACLQPGVLPELPRIDNVRLTVRNDTAIIDFEPIDGALDYRIYPLPDPADVLVGENGEVAIRNAIYRCAGDRVMGDRERIEYSGFPGLEGDDNWYHGTTRTAADNVLGYVYLTPSEGRTAIYRVANPSAVGGFPNSEWISSMYHEGNAADYLPAGEQRDARLASGWRDDGIAFYVPNDGTLTVHRAEYNAEILWMGEFVTFFYTDGPENDARNSQPAEDFVDRGPRFQIYAEPAEGTVPLYRLTYQNAHVFDVLAAGESRYQRALHQGIQPVWSLSWPGITETTTFVIEALDQGCPFPGGYVAPFAHAADIDRTSMQPFNQPSLTVDEARLSSGEVFINGQHDATNRPRPVARAYVEVTPQPDPEMDFFEGFDEGMEWGGFTEYRDNNAFVFRSEDWAIDGTGCSDNFTFGPMLGQFVLGMSDYGSSCNVSITPRNVDTQIAAGRFLHVRMSTDIPSTGRRYPQIMITNVPMNDAVDTTTAFDLPIHTRFGDTHQSIVVQPFGGQHELDIQFCDNRGWGVNLQCPEANVYGHHVGNYSETWSEPWTPVPVLGDLAGFDRPVRFDVWASTERVYVYVDDRPAGCAVLPAGRMPAGAVTVAYRAVLYHCGIDESVTPENTGHRYEQEYSICHSDRHMDDFGIELSTEAPPWDESVLPCGERWFGGE